MFTTSGTNPWSFVTQIFHNGQPRDGGDRKIFEVMTSTLPKGTLGSVASLLPFQVNISRKRKNDDKGETLNTSKNYIKYCIFYQNLDSPPSGLRDLN